MPLLNLGREAELTSGILKEEGGSIARQNQKKRIRGYLPRDPSRESLNGMQELSDVEVARCLGEAKSDVWREFLSGILQISERSEWLLAEGERVQFKRCPTSEGWGRRRNKRGRRSERE